MLTATSETGVCYAFTYDAYGNNTSVSILGNDLHITSRAAYSEDGNLLLSTTDALGNVTSYGYEENTGLLLWVQYPEDTAESRTQYTYDNMYRLATTTAQVDGEILSASYTYEDDYLTSLQTGSTTYSFAYGAFGLRENIKIGSRTLAAYTYTSRDNQLASLDYGNGDKVEYTYDTQGRITQETYENGDTVSYRYDNSGALATVTDSATGRTTTYYYDFTDRLMKTVEQGTDFCHSLGYEYDSINNLTKLVNTINGVALETSYSYDLDNRITGQTQGDTTLSYHYDGYSRLNQVRTKHTDTTLLIHSYEFRRPTSGATSGQVEKHTIGTTRVMTRYSYTYDDNGNILSISDGTNTTSYAYDTANQLIRENNQAAGKTITWTYDNAGNILTRTEYAYTTVENPGTPTNTVNYTYGDESWGDLLTAYDGVAITYDEIGNPLTDGTYTYTWEHGRQLRSISDGTTTWTYTYDASGLRTSASNGTVTDQYVYTGGQLTMMRKNGICFYFTYDANGSPCTISYGTNTFYYVTNLQGDVIALLDSTGATVAQYTYDAWGNPLTVTGPHLVMAEYNPLRYRGYVYDTATGLYYLQSRYYNPEIGRFINADVILVNSHILGLNLFAYCENAPVVCKDSSGFGKIYVIYYDREGNDFYEQAYNSVYFSSSHEDVIMIGVTTSQEFVEVWNDIGEDADYVYLYLHGGVGELYFVDGDLSYEENESGMSFNSLDKKDIKYGVYLFSCKGGKGNSSRNVAKMFRALTNTNVIACNGSVSYSKNKDGKYYPRTSKRDLGFSEWITFSPLSQSWTTYTIDGFRKIIYGVSEVVK